LRPVGLATSDVGSPVRFWCCATKIVTICVSSPRLRFPMVHVLLHQ